MHLVSMDLDFFLSEGLERDEVLGELSGLEIGAKVMSQTSAHCELIINAVKVDLLRERIPRHYPLKSLDLDSTSINMAHPVDIGRMKLFSIAGRGSRKDLI